MTMEYQKIINLLNSTLNQTSKFWKKYSAETNNDSHGACNKNSQIRSKYIMIKLQSLIQWLNIQRSNLCHYIDAYILAKETISFAAVEVGEVNNNKKSNN